jgi:hypothetical protein
MDSEDQFDYQKEALLMLGFITLKEEIKDMDLLLVISEDDLEAIEEELGDRGDAEIQNIFDEIKMELAGLHEIIECNGDSCASDSTVEFDIEDARDCVCTLLIKVNKMAEKFEPEFFTHVSFEIYKNIAKAYNLKM